MSKMLIVFSAHRIFGNPGAAGRGHRKYIILKARYKHHLGLINGYQQDSVIHLNVLHEQKSPASCLVVNADPKAFQINNDFSASCGIIFSYHPICIAIGR